MKTVSIEYQALIVLCTQIIFLYLRTLNVKAVTEGLIWKAIWTGNGIAIAWMIGIAVGANAMMEGEFLPIIAHLLGGTVGTVLGMKENKRKFKKRKS